MKFPSNILLNLTCVNVFHTMLQEANSALAVASDGMSIRWHWSHPKIDWALFQIGFCWRSSSEIFAGTGTTNTRSSVKKPVDAFVSKSSKSHMVATYCEHFCVRKRVSQCSFNARSRKCIEGRIIARNIVESFCPFAIRSRIMNKGGSVIGL